MKNQLALKMLTYSYENNKRSFMKQSEAEHILVIEGSRIKRKNGKVQ
jgi:hypothetical protein